MAPTGAVSGVNSRKIFGTLTTLACRGLVHPNPSRISRKSRGRRQGGRETDHPHSNCCSARECRKRCARRKLRHRRTQEDTGVFSIFRFFRKISLITGHYRRGRKKGKRWAVLSRYTSSSLFGSSNKRTSSRSTTLPAARFEEIKSSRETTKND